MDRTLFFVTVGRCEISHPVLSLFYVKIRDLFFYLIYIIAIIANLYTTWKIVGCVVTHLLTYFSMAHLIFLKTI